MTVYKLENDNLISENTTTKPTKVLKTSAGDKDTPRVKTFPIAGFQRAILKKKINHCISGDYKNNIRNFKKI